LPVPREARMNRVLADAMDHAIGSRPVACGRAFAWRNAFDVSIITDAQRVSVILLPPAQPNDLVIGFPIRKRVVASMKNICAATLTNEPLKSLASWSRPKRTTSTQVVARLHNHVERLEVRTP